MQGAAEPSSGPALRALIGLVARTSGMAAARRALPTYMGLFVIAVILFTGNGVRSSDVVALAIGSPPTRIGLLAAWLLLALPAARALVAAPSAFLIRTWPIPRAQLLGVTAGPLALVETPWALLWFKGGGVLLGAAATVLTIGGHGILLARPRAAAEVGAALSWAVALAALSHPALSLCAGAPAAWLCVRRAFLAAPERIGVTRTWRLVHAGHFPALALAQAQLATLLRAQRPALLRAVWFAGGGALMAGLAIVNNRIADPDRVRAIWRTLAALTIGWGTTGLVGGVQRVERESGWLLAVHGASAAQRRLGAALPMIALGAGLGALAGAVLGRALPGAAASATSATIGMAAAGAGAGAAGSACAGAAGRWACRGNGQDSARLLASMLATGGLLATFGWLAPDAVQPGALLVLAAGTLALPEPPRARRSRRVSADG